MADHTKPANEFVHVRLIGRPEAVDRVVARVADALIASDPSAHLPSQKNPDHVRVHFEVIV